IMLQCAQHCAIVWVSKHARLTTISGSRYKEPPMSDITAPPSAPGGVQSSSAGAMKRAGRYAAYVFWLMFIINFLNYLDRWIFTGLSLVIQRDLLLDDFQIGLLTTGFLLVYTIVAMPLGFLADRRSRSGIVGLGVAIWSIATALTGLANS